MSLLSTLANATGLSAPGSLLPPPAIPCICPLKLLDQLKSLIPTLPIEFPEIPVPDLKGLDPLVAAAPATPANSFIRARLDLVGKIKIPPALARIPLDPMQLGGMQSAPPLVRLVEGMMKTKIDDPKIALKVQGSLAGLTKIPLPPLPPIPDGQLPPPPPAHVQRLSVTVTQMRMARAVLGLKLVPIAPRSLVKLQLAIKAAATVPPLPLEQMAPLAPLAAIVNVAVRMGIDLRAPQAIARLAAKLAAVAQLPPPPPPPPALPQVLNLLGIPKIYDNIATFFKLDLAKLSIPDIQARISLPLQPLAAVAGTLDAALTPGQAANAQTWAAAPQFFPALRLMETIDMGRLDFAPLKDLPPLDNIAAMTAFMQLGEAANSAPKGAAPKSAAQKDAASKSAAKCPQCPLR